MQSELGKIVRSNRALALLPVKVVRPKRGKAMHHSFVIQMPTLLRGALPSKHHHHKNTKNLVEHEARTENNDIAARGEIKETTRNDPMIGASST